MNWLSSTLWPSCLLDKWVRKWTCVSWINIAYWSFQFRRKRWQLYYNMVLEHLQTNTENFPAQRIKAPKSLMQFSTAQLHGLLLLPPLKLAPVAFRELHGRLDFIRPSVWREPGVCRSGGLNTTWIDEYLVQFLLSYLHVLQKKILSALPQL